MYRNISEGFFYFPSDQVEGKAWTIEAKVPYLVRWWAARAGACVTVWDSADSAGREPFSPTNTVVQGRQQTVCKIIYSPFRGLLFSLLLIMLASLHLLLSHYSFSKPSSWSVLPSILSTWNSCALLHKGLYLLLTLFAISLCPLMTSWAPANQHSDYNRRSSRSHSPRRKDSDMSHDYSSAHSGYGQDRGWDDYYEKRGRGRSRSPGDDCMSQEEKPLKYLTADLALLFSRSQTTAVSFALWKRQVWTSATIWRWLWYDLIESAHHD